MATDRHRDEARRLLSEACGVILDTITASMIEPWASALADAERRGAERMREAAASECSARAAREWADCGHPIENEQAHGAQVARTLCATVLALDPDAVLAAETRGETT